MKQAIIIFAKNAVYGKVKTRLASTTGHMLALIVYKKLLVYTASISHGLNADKFVYYTDGIEPNDAFNNKKYFKKTQRGNGLGERMLNAFDELFEQGYKQVIIIGSDCLELSSTIISGAFESLKNTDIVIGPALDGGYYLLGMKKTNSSLFQDINWSSSEVFNQTMHICKKEKLSVKRLKILSDVDTEADLDRARGKLLAINLEL